MRDELRIELRTTEGAIRIAVRKAAGHMSAIALRSERDSMVYAWQCTARGRAWKMYQSQSHYESCGPHLVDLRKLHKGRRVRHAKHGSGTVVSIRRERNPNGAQRGTGRQKIPRLVI